MMRCRPSILNVVLLLLVGACEPETATGRRAQLEPREALGASADADGYARAFEPRPFAFPADHGPHEGYRTEWWYATGNLDGSGGRRFGYQLTIFRSALRPEAEERASAWSTRDVYLGHFALTDAMNGRLHGFERFARGGSLGLAGSAGEPFRVWLEGWEFRGVEAEGAFPMRVRAADGDVTLDLVLEPEKSVVLQGDRGLSQKSAEPGNASYYYSYTRLRTTGTVRVAGESSEVSGLSWFDREWSTSALGDDVVGWDWFALQLDDGRDLMFYRLRREDGSASPISAGTLVGPKGERVVSLGIDDVEVEVADRWRSEDGVTYPVRWRLRVPEHKVDVVVAAVVADQEHADFLVRYWEGAVDVSLTASGQPAGRGYVELTGYAASAGDE